MTSSSFKEEMELPGANPMDDPLRCTKLIMHLAAADSAIFSCHCLSFFFVKLKLKINLLELIYIRTTMLTQLTSLFK